MMIGYFIANYSLFYKSRELYLRYEKKASTREKGRLTENEIEEITQYQVDQVTSDFIGRSDLALSDDIINDSKSLSIHQRLGLLAKTFLDNHPGIKSVANIGARVDIVSSYLAQKYPDISFISVDLQPNLAKHNSLLPSSPNWTFMSGYALDLLETGELAPDVILFSSTSVLFRNKELDQYFAAFSKVTKYIVFNEPWGPSAKRFSLRGITRPEEINPSRSEIGGYYCNYKHNYISKLKDNGFVIETSNLIPNKPNKKHYYDYILQIVARNTKF